MPRINLDIKFEVVTVEIDGANVEIFRIEAETRDGKMFVSSGSSKKLAMLGFAEVLFKQLSN